MVKRRDSKSRRSARMRGFDPHPLRQGSGFAGTFFCSYLVQNLIIIFPITIAYAIIRTVTVKIERKTEVYYAGMDCADDK